jgi:hypothetical protein
MATATATATATMRLELELWSEGAAGLVVVLLTSI